jgi:hypothetical protein
MILKKVINNALMITIFLSIGLIGFQILYSFNFSSDYTDLKENRLSNCQNNSNESYCWIFYNRIKAFEGYTFIGGTLYNMDGKDIHNTLGATLFDPINKMFLDRTNDENNYLIKYDWDENIIWEKNIPTYREMAMGQNNTYYVISREPKQYMNRSVVFNVFYQLDENGNTLYNWSTFLYLDKIQKFHDTLLLDDPNREIVVLNRTFWIGSKKRQMGFHEYYDANSIQEIPSNKWSNTDRKFQKGNLLVSLNAVNLIVIIDKNSSQIVWYYGPGNIINPGSPKMLKNGNIILFDNGNDELRPYSRIIELNPTNKQIVWEYVGNPKESFYSNIRGTVQRLPNNNTLITSSAQGYVFEVTSLKEIVWEFRKPIIEDDHRTYISRAIRYPVNQIDE